MNTTVSRKNLTHFDEMSNKAFHAIMKSSTEWGRLGVIPIQVNRKLDGAFISFGRDKDGRVWLATARSGKIYEPCDFTSYTLKKFANSDPKIKEDAMRRASAYRGFLRDLIEEIDISIGRGEYVIGELFDHYMANQTIGYDESTIKFVNLPYSLDKFRKTRVVYVYETNMICDYTETDNRHFQFRDPLLYTGRFVIPKGIWSTYLQFEEDLKKVRPTHSSKWILQQLKRSLGESIYEYIGNLRDLYDLGACEGIVVEFPEAGSKFKIASPEFRQLVKKNK